jgi:phenylacetate-CoA ligase
VSDVVRRLSEAGYWASQSAQGKGAIRRRLARLNAMQWWTPDEIRAFQLEKLKRLVTHCHETVPYYREVMDERGIDPRDIVDPQSFAALPLLTRELLGERQADLVSRVAELDALPARHSSGSTGVRVEVRQDRDFDMWCRAHQLRTYAWCGGWRLGDPFVLAWGSPVLFESRTRAARIDNRIARRTETNAFRLDRRSVDRTLDALARAQPRLVSGYTTALYLLAQRALERGIALPRLAAVQATAEPLAPAMRATIAEGLDCAVFDKYGSRETSIVAHESPAHDGMCIQAEHTYVEFLDAGGAACRPGQAGRLVLTTLNNRAQPLLRYETTDIAAPIPGRCPSGIGLPRMTAVSGRLQDMLVTPDGGLVHPQLFSNVMRQFPLVRWFQIVQEADARLLVRVVTAAGSLPDLDRQLVAAMIRRHAGFDYAIGFEHLADMPDASTATGKFRLCVCAMPAARHRALGDLNAIRMGDPS